MSALQVCDKVTPLSPLTAKSSLSNEDIMRYSRQLLLPELGVQGMEGEISYGPYFDIVIIHHFIAIVLRAVEFVQDLSVSRGLRRTRLPPGTVSCCSRHRYVVTHRLALTTDCKCKRETI